MLKDISDGKGAEVGRQNLRRDGNIGASSRGLEGVDWDSWKGRFHLKQVTILGHSFGAATAVEVLRHADRFQWVGQGIIYDIWGAAIQPPESQPEHRINAPLLGINSEAFMYWPDNFKAVMSLCEEAKEHGALCWLLTVRGSVHISQSDFSILYPKMSSLILKMTLNPRRAIDLNVNASLEFLKRVMPERISSMNRGTDEGLLEMRTLDELPPTRRPKTKWMAVRLKVPHELRLRLTPGIVRKVVRKKSRRERGHIATDPDGHVLAGLEELELGDEIWMHVAPTSEELEQHGIGGRREVQGGGRDGMVDVPKDVCTKEDGTMDSEHAGSEEKHHAGLEERTFGHGERVNEVGRQ